MNDAPVGVEFLRLERSKFASAVRSDLLDRLSKLVLCLRKYMLLRQQKLRS